MNRKAGNDLTPSLPPLVARGPQTLVVAPFTTAIGPMRPHVMLRVGEELDSQMMWLTPAEARQIAISLLTAAEEVEASHSKAPRSN